MNYLKLLGKSLLYIVSILLTSTIIITILNYFNIFGSKLATLFKIIIPVISMFVGGFIIGKNTKSKGWLEGLKLGIIVIIILLMINLIILKPKWELRNIIFYLILIISTIFGSMIGINKKIEEK
ncbi:MAG: TIGR04086 family membrane protein [Firmicutes bacterium]|nr:TIGR04086 family membrane protein [Bacillota bacterium]